MDGWEDNSTSVENSSLLIYVVLVLYITYLHQPSITPSGELFMTSGPSLLHVFKALIPFLWNPDQRLWKCIDLVIVLPMSFSPAALGSSSKGSSGSVFAHHCIPEHSPTLAHSRYTTDIPK